MKDINGSEADGINDCLTNCSVNGTDGADGIDAGIDGADGADGGIRMNTREVSFLPLEELME